MPSVRPFALDGFAEIADPKAQRAIAILRGLGLNTDDLVRKLEWFAARLRRERKALLKYRNADNHAAALAELAGVNQAVASRAATGPTPPRQFFPVLQAPDTYPPLPKTSVVADARCGSAFLKDPDDGYCFGASVGLLVDYGTRFVRAMSFDQRRREHEVRRHGRMLRITFSRPRPPRPFAIGSQCHFGLGLFVPANGGSFGGRP